ncbi:FMN-dependent NADH-azoreductase [Sulfitobacter aestuariivivens]|uniref:FMN dependent NADH:quinone oxidoreductase n=1 Tax=Sulfitobacter aestuariivivens TaxID=2766981 RepID=A0A927D8D9_9RHOB|nr:NAD(P)H-dependent oxidoreductase [Sulfitobacter aestuariivivens]MBD3664651.1 NAD(P)H-dependent oxidoreductase [Sulfitobacter aestuariivivens]
MTILRIDSSVNTKTSVTRSLTDRIIATLGDADVLTRDLSKSPVPQITESWAEARIVPPADRSPAQHAELALSDALVAELEAADTIVIGLPVYNFSVPASLKAWIDQVARVGVTFRYTPDGPVGLLKGKRVILAVASGGTAVGSDIDFATGYMQHVLGFLGIKDVTVIAADALATEPEKTLARAHAQIDGLRMAA